MENEHRISIVSLSKAMNIIQSTGTICVTIHEKIPSLSSGARASATYINDF